MCCNSSFAWLHFSIDRTTEIDRSTSYELPLHLCLYNFFIKLSKSYIKQPSRSMMVCLVGFSFDYFFYTTTFFPHSITFRPHIFSLIFLHYHFFWIFWCFSLFRVIYTNMFWSISFWLSFSHSITLTNQCLLHLHYTFSRHFIYTNMCFTFKFICTHGFLTDFFALI